MANYVTWVTINLSSATTLNLDEPNIASACYGLNTMLWTIRDWLFEINRFATMDIIGVKCRARPAFTYVDPDLALHYQLLGTLPLSYFSLFPISPCFYVFCSTCPLQTLLVTSSFSFSHSVFCSIGELAAIFIEFEIVVCKLFEFGKV